MSENTGRKLVRGERVRMDLKSWTIIFLVAGLFLFLSPTRKNFLTFNNIHSLLYGVSFNFFAAVGFTFLIIMGELDMSVGSLYGLGGSLMGLFIFRFKMGSLPAILIAIAIAFAVGWLVGFLITTFRLNSMMVTIGMMMAVKGVNWTLVNMFAGKQFPLANYNFIRTQWFHVSWLIWLMLIVAIILEVLLSTTWHFRQMYASGDNMETARLYGLRAGMVKRLCFAVSAALSAFGGAMATARLKHPDVTVGGDLEVTIITAAVIGGASIFGGRGSVVRSMLGLFFVAMLQNGMTAYGINSYIQQVILGIVLIAAIYLDLRINEKQN